MEKTASTNDYAGVDVCPSCGGAAVVENRVEDFTYGRGADSALLTTKPVPVGTCEPCGVSFGDSRLEDAREEAVVAAGLRRKP